MSDENTIVVANGFIVSLLFFCMNTVEFGLLNPVVFWHLNGRDHSLKA